MAKNYTAKEAIEVIIKNEDAAAVLDVTRRFSSLALLAARVRGNEVAEEVVAGLPDFLMARKFDKTLRGDSVSDVDEGDSEEEAPVKEKKAEKPAKKPAKKAAKGIDVDDDEDDDDEEEAPKKKAKKEAPKKAKKAAKEEDEDEEDEDDEEEDEKPAKKSKKAAKKSKKDDDDDDDFDFDED